MFPKDGKYVCNSCGETKEIGGKAEVIVTDSRDKMMKVIEGTEWAERVPKELPIYNIAGDADPVGNYGEGVYLVSNWLIETGHDVTTMLYPGFRHEIHNYDEIKDEVEWGIIEFMDGVLAR